MNSYHHHIGDFNTATRHLSRLERDVYRDMRDMYFDKETALPGADMALLAKRLVCRTDEELAAMQFVLAEFFVQQADGSWRNEDCERQIATFHASQEVRGEVKKNENDRQTRSRARRGAMFSALRGKGLALAYNTKMPDLYRLCAEHGLDTAVLFADLDNVTPPVTATAVTRHAPDTANQNQNHNQIEQPPNPPAGGADGSRDASRQPGQPAVVGAEAMALAAELAEFFPQHRRVELAKVGELLQQLLAAGEVTADALIAAATAQQPTLAHEGGKACPKVLRWLKDKRWMDSAAAGHAPGNWRESRSSIEAMGMSLGMLPFEHSGFRLLSGPQSYEAEVARRLNPEAVPA